MKLKTIKNCEQRVKNKIKMKEKEQKLQKRNIRKLRKKKMKKKEICQ